MKLALFVLSCTVLAVYAAPKAKCPAVKAPKLNPGCVEVSGTDAAGCPTLEVQCLHVDPPRQEATIRIAPRVARSSAPLADNPLPVQHPIPTPDIHIADHPLAPEPVLADHHRVRRYGHGGNRRVARASGKGDLRRVARGNGGFVGK